MLANKKTLPHRGEVFLNGRPRDRLFSRVTTYVPQQDIIPPFWTVAEAIEFHHRLRFEGDLSPEARIEHIEKILSSLGLSCVKNSRIGGEQVRGISGGQRRRVSLAKGLAAGSQIVFADEPTSGLSATDADLCVRVMAATSRRQGITFVIVIHQPRIEVTKMFDELLLLTSQPGRVVYNGTFCKVAGYFAEAGFKPPMFSNPADHYLDVITPEVRWSKADYFADRYLELQKGDVDKAVEVMIAQGGATSLEMLNEICKKRGVSKMTDSRFSVSFGTQLRTLLGRRMTLMIRDQNQLQTRLAVSLLQGLVIGIAYWDVGSKLPAQQVPFLFMLLQMGSLSNMATMPEIISHRLVFKYETSDGLYLSAASVLVDTLVNTILTLGGNFITIIVMYSLSGLPWEHLWLVYFWSLLCLMAVTNFFKIIAAVAPSSSHSLLVAMPGLMLFTLFNNFFVNKSTVPAFMEWALYVSPMAWTIEQIITGMYGKDATLVTLYGYDDSDEQTARAFTALIVESILFQLIAMVCLKVFNNIER